LSGAVADGVLRLDAEEEGGGEVVDGEDARLPVVLFLLVRKMIWLLQMFGFVSFNDTHYYATQHNNKNVTILSLTVFNKTVHNIASLIFKKATIVALNITIKMRLSA